MSNDEKQTAALERLGAAYQALEESVAPFRRELDGGEPVTDLEGYLRAAAQEELDAAYAAYAAIVYAR